MCDFVFVYVFCTRSVVCYFTGDLVPYGCCTPLCAWILRLNLYINSRRLRKKKFELIGANSQIIGANSTNWD